MVYITIGAPPILAEGDVTFDDRAGGEYTIMKFDNGASVMLSRNTLMFALTRMEKHAMDGFGAQQAKIVDFHKQAKRRRK